MSCEKRTAVETKPTTHMKWVLMIHILDFGIPKGFMRI